MGILIVVILVVVLFFVIKSNSVQSNNNSFKGFIDKIAINGLTPFEDDDINPELGEQCLLKYFSIMLGYKTMKGREIIHPITNGALYLTTNKVIFAGDNRTLTIRFKDIVKIDCDDTLLRLHLDKKPKPIILQTKQATIFEYCLKAHMNHALIINEIV